MIAKVILVKMEVPALMLLPDILALAHKALLVLIAKLILMTVRALLVITESA